MPSCESCPPDMHTLPLTISHSEKCPPRTLITIVLERVMSLISVDTVCTSLPLPLFPPSVRSTALDLLCPAQSSRPHTLRRPSSLSLSISIVAIKYKLENVKFSIIASKHHTLSLEGRLRLDSSEQAGEAVGCWHSAQDTHTHTH